MARGDRTPGALVDYLQNLLGDGFRSCVTYGPEGGEVHYLRSDIPREAAAARIERLANLSAAERDVVSSTPDDPGLGPLRASVYLFDGAIVVHLVDPDGSAVGFSLEPQAGTNLEAFIDDCLDVLYGSAP